MLLFSLFRQRTAITQGPSSFVFPPQLPYGSTCRQRYSAVLTCLQYRHCEL